MVSNMDLYERMRNISGESNEEGLKKSITTVKEKLKDLTEERTCKIYNGLLYQELINNHIPSKLMNTKDLDMDYEHVYVMVLGDIDGYLLADLTFSQFNNNSVEFNDLIQNGYQHVNDKLMDDYLDIMADHNLNKTIKNLNEENSKKR